MTIAVLCESVANFWRLEHCKNIHYSYIFAIPVRIYVYVLR